jgi:hypothetical protein
MMYSVAPAGGSAKLLGLVGPLMMNLAQSSAWNTAWRKDATF